MVARLTPSSQLKRCPDKCLSKAGHRRKSLDAKCGLYGYGPRVSSLLLAAGSETSVSYAVWALSPRRNAPSLRRPGRCQCTQELYDSFDFQARPVFQVGQHVELPQPYAFHYMSVRTRPRRVCLSTAVEVATKSESIITELVNFFHPFFNIVNYRNQNYLCNLFSVHINNNVYVP